jgi:hypothetical protein
VVLGIDLRIDAGPLEKSCNQILFD